MTNRTCTVEGCERPHKGHGLCDTHNARLRRTGTTEARLPVLGCTVLGCPSVSRITRGLCHMHYARLRRTGTTSPMPRRRARGTGSISVYGYIVVTRPGHPLASVSGKVREHRIVLYDLIGAGVHSCHWCGRAISWAKSYPRDIDGLVVDHLDFDKLNNDSRNLVPSCNPCNVARLS